MFKVLSPAAIAVTLIFFASTLAEAIEFKFGGQMRPRYQFVDHKGVTGFEADLSPEQFWSTRVRFNVTIKLDENNSGFIQLQGRGVWGDFGNLGTGGRSAFFANTNVFDVGFHQAYFTVKNLYGIPVDLQVGRQELVLDGHRLFGNVGWTEGGRSHDGIRITHTQDNLTLLYFYSKTLEQDNFGFTSSAADPGDDLDFNTHILWGNYKGLIGDKSSTSLYFVYFDGGNRNPDTAGPPAIQAAESDNDIYTVGIRQAGNLLGIDYRGEFYYQFGQAENYTFRSSGFGFNPLGYAPYDTATLGAGSGIDRHAYMFGVRVGKRFVNIPWKPSITAWYDHLSGTDQDDVNNNEFSSFSTLFATQHKFYGHMDNYYVGNIIPSGFSVGFMGLRNLAVKTSIQPHKKLLLRADWHWFWTDTDLSDPANSPLATSFGCSCNTDLGQELDITLIHPYNEWFTFTVGYSHYFSTRSFKNISIVPSDPTNSDDADWAFAQFDWRF